MARDRARHVLETAPIAIPLHDDGGEQDPDLLLFVGDDPNGVPLEVVVRLSGDTVRVIHVMRMRPKYRPLYDQVTR